PILRKIVSLRVTVVTIMAVTTMIAKMREMPFGRCPSLREGSLTLAFTTLTLANARLHFLIENFF
ncbi:hypothetical protein COT83_02450, partial [Candidatus Peregrinibacteria bacterium CG10_big_fil_rev_8_21_14_0_10_44_7]